MDIPGKVAVVTGAASGIGRAVSIELADRGVSGIALVDLNEGVREVAGEIADLTGERLAECYVGDVTKEAFRREVFDRIAAKHAVPSICVPAAGITRDAIAVKMDRETGKALVYPLETFRQVIEVDLIAPIYWALEMVARIAEDRKKKGLGRWEPVEHVQGTAIFIGSISSLGNKGQIAYSATKAGLGGAAATLTVEAMYHGVRCGVIHPGFTNTPMVRALSDKFVEEHILPNTQLRRLIRPQEIADAICFMIANSAVSGELWADAGWHPAP